MKTQWKRMLLVVMIFGAMLVVSACQAEESVPKSTIAGTEQNSNTTTSTEPMAESAVVVNDAVENALDATEQLAMGTLMLEETAEAVTPEQANKLLPLWNLMQGGDLSSDAETDAVLKQIRAAMTDAQLVAIDAVSSADLEVWYGERGVQMPAPGDAPEGAASGGMAGDMTEEERAEMRENLQNMTEEERAQMREERGGTAPEGGMPAGRGASGTGGGNALIRPLVMLLQQRAAE